MVQLNKVQNNVQCSNICDNEFAYMCIRYNWKETHENLIKVCCLWNINWIVERQEWKETFPFVYLSVTFEFLSI